MATVFENTREFSASTHTAADAAAQLGCEIGQIAKSIVFQGLITGEPVLVIASGKHRVDTNIIEAVIGEPVGKADAEYCREKTGYVIGAIPPYGHRERLRTLFDETLCEYDVIYAAAGTQTSVFQTTPQTLMTAADATCVSISME
jgi:prolyl-tRNA editing enzyme YbaK/EbsC (Cys-tRNA(Pro) deacylase)